jgi:hypothetical protein
MNRKIKRVCIVDSIYTLFLYLLYTSEDELNETYYFFGNTIRDSIRKRISYYYHFDITKKINKNIIWRFLSLKFVRFFRWPFLRKATIFAQDHLLYSPYIIGQRDYTFIEDGPHMIQVYFHDKLYRDTCEYWSKKYITIKKLLNYIISDVYNRTVANNTQCKELVLTVDDDIPYIAGKIKHIVSLEKLWNSATAHKKKIILDIYDLSEMDIKFLKTRTHIILTQQFSADGLISEQEQVKLYADIIKKYDPLSLILKTHPRDLVDYRKYFPDVAVFDKIIPMQLLNLVGIRFKKVTTVFSSSISLFPYEIEKEWIGSSVHPNLYKRYPYLAQNIF